jgi:hypothetical protein
MHAVYTSTAVFSLSVNIKALFQNRSFNQNCASMTELLKVLQCFCIIFSQQAIALPPLLLVKSVMAGGEKGWRDGRGKTGSCFFFYYLGATQLLQEEGTRLAQSDLKANLEEFSALSVSCIDVP